MGEVKAGGNESQSVLAIGNQGSHQVERECSSGNFNKTRL